jgi:hypothetical protein
MPSTTAWREVESQIYRPGLWGLLVGSGFFFVVGGFSFLIPDDAPDGGNLWIIYSLRLGAIAIGIAMLAWAAKCRFYPASIRYADPSVLPNVETGPVIFEGAAVHCVVTHDLVETDDAWKLLPSSRYRRRDKAFLFGVGIPMLLLLCASLTWKVHTDMNIEKEDAQGLFAALGANAPIMVGGAWPIFCFYMMFRCAPRKLSKLIIPKNGSSLELDELAWPQPQKSGLEWIKWGFLYKGDNRRKRVIPREILAAVQLCPWTYRNKLSEGPTVGRAVQGVLVLKTPDHGGYQRLPLFLTWDYLGAAKLMQHLAQVLQVPYLFYADAAGWELEEERANNRPSLRMGGMMD